MATDENRWRKDKSGAKMEQLALRQLCPRGFPSRPPPEGVDGCPHRVHRESVSNTKKTSLPKEKKTPGTIMAEVIRTRANKLTDGERESLLGDAMRIIYGNGGKAAHAHRR